MIETIHLDVPFFVLKYTIMSVMHSIFKILLAVTLVGAHTGGPQPIP